MAGKPLGAKSAQVTLAPLGAQEAASIADADLFAGADPKASFAVAELLVDGRAVSRTIVERALPKDMPTRIPRSKAPSA